MSVPVQDIASFHSDFPHRVRSVCDSMEDIVTMSRWMRDQGIVHIPRQDLNMGITPDAITEVQLINSKIVGLVFFKDRKAAMLFKLAWGRE